MAAEQHDNNGATSETMIHVRNYEGFTRIVKWSAVAVFIIAMTVVYIISK